MAIEQNPGRIYLAAQRGRTETEHFRSYNSFPFGGYQPEGKPAFGSVYVFNEDTLAPRQGLRLMVEEDSWVFVLPLVGGLSFGDATGRCADLASGNLLAAHLKAGTKLSLENPFDEHAVRYVHVWVRGAAEGDPFRIIPIGLASSPDRLLPLFSSASAGVSIGRFAGRSETICKLGEEGAFFWVVQGAFEVQYRLLEAGDGLALWDSPEAEIEALSEEAILLVVGGADRSAP